MAASGLGKSSERRNGLPSRSSLRLGGAHLRPLNADFGTAVVAGRYAASEDWW